MPRSSQNPTPAPPGHVWIDEASRLTGLSVKTLYNRRYKDESPSAGSFPIGRKLAFPLEGPDGIKAWFEAQRNPAPDADKAHSSRPPEPRRLRNSRPSQHPVKAAA
ncbi:hypothetical protein [Streptomyces sp. NBC_00338]|uniref:hypothetical protein n=1 Tax=Streptomyces sp. NBC_00338 TaxID=2975715 RepID=UPI00224ED3B7|nr:hypothetical protein [Streptomyces sp. NBC_00338]MCX5138379.1 helix-turn-helix domain-containing protein [Streptomyces sp. NBC_00338]MCX5145168.1 helix-turn-helix domain-containing protein [Streptomyces sp. NBC_00338]